MEWTEIVIETDRAGAAQAEAIATACADAGIYVEDYADLEEQVWQIAHVDLIEEELRQKSKEIVRIHLYFSPEENAAKITEKLAGLLLAAGVRHALQSRGVQQEDWETAWKQYYHPVPIGKKLVVVPSWEHWEPDGRAVLTLDPGMAFGTGTHETTVLCMEALEELVRDGDAVLDIGTGSGILSIAALLLGAGEALGIDIDPMCVRTAAENAARNGVSQRFTAREGDLASAAQGAYDIVTANIIADAILRLAPEAPGLLKPGGCFVASGVIQPRCAEVADGLKKAGFNTVEIRQKNDWVALVCRV